MKSYLIALLVLGLAFVSCKVVETPVEDDDDNDNDDNDNDNNDNDDNDSTSTDADADSDSDGDIDTGGTGGDCPQGSGYPCSCSNATEQMCGDGSPCVSPNASGTVGFCSIACSGTGDDKVCQDSAQGWGVTRLPAGCYGDVDGNGSVDHCMIVCELQGATAPCPTGLTCNKQGVASVCM